MSKSISKILAGLVLATFVSSCAERNQMPAKPFEGTITEAIHVPGISKLMNGLGNPDDSSDHSSANSSEAMGGMMGAFANIGLTMHVRDNLVAYDVSLLGGMITIHSIIDRNARTLTVLMPNQTAMVTNLRSLDSTNRLMGDSLRSHNSLFDSLQAALPEPTGNHETIEGLDAEEYHAEHGKYETDLWLASDAKLEAFDIVRDAFLGRGTEGSGGLDQVFAMMRPIAGKIPVRFNMKMDGSSIASGEVTEIKEEKLDNSIFEIPKGYTIVNEDSMRATHEQHRNHFTAP